MKDINNDKMAIAKLLEIMQEGYTKRAVEDIDEYTEKLFVKSDEMIILGTSCGEWCLGYEDSKMLIENDWKYWGNVIIDRENLELTTKGDIAWFSTLGSVEKDFSLSDKTYDNFVNYAKEYLYEERCWLGEISDETRLTTIAWELTHLLTGQGKKYRWEIRLSGLAIKEEDGWKFTQLQFSFPTTLRYPDERIWDDNFYDRSHQHGFGKLREYNSTKDVEQSGEVRGVLNNFSNEFLSKELTSEQLVDKYFSKEQDIRVLGTDTDKYNGHDQVIQSVQNYKTQWDELKIGVEEAIVSVCGDTAWVITQGEANVTITRKDAIRMEIEKSKEILESDLLPSKEKLLRINRNVITMLNEASKGENNIWSIRFDAVLLKENNTWVIHTMQFSYPANIILEGKTDAATLIG
ncbi:nuclear transport factor 2 family protein [Alkalicella caledoniensis]|uniref:Nuclear transport factor 2 family protein n=1 Tax=Alkalicella caledoniensis TaxID=2731377 RepID=A0A7G9WB91_ALKCA|nr:nuclear transport factor 2 family protein [Alkalicella caledoniensis]QNO15953.1 nuclear transport factor 2 family protein [Alkalicella caledoniensis]